MITAGRRRVLVRLAGGFENRGKKRVLRRESTGRKIVVTVRGVMGREREEAVVCS